MRVSWMALLALPLLPFLPGCPSCPYNEACEGNVLKYCSLGVDQLVGSPSEGEVTCSGANPSCVTVDERDALCAIAKERTCTVGAAPRCEGQQLITCQEGFEVAEDCGAHGNVCGTLLAETFCYKDPVLTCAPESFRPRCEGTRLIQCRNGVEAIEECGLRVEDTTCRTTTGQYASSFCAPPS
ncbi:MAG: hypothetical protein IPG45_10650 [Deltaproteobacteria bacterium]|nr:hypothetical protein [Deltaproteobacteria bacterium]